MLLNSRLHSLYLKVSLLVSIFVLFDEVLGLEDGSVRVHFDDIHVFVLLARDLLACDNVTNVNDTTIVLLSRIVVKEDMLGVIVSLVNHEKLGAVIGTT